MSERNIETTRKLMNEARRKPELLAPVGGREQLKAAVYNGADAVYMGGALFNARMKAENFRESGDDLQGGSGHGLQAAIDFAHEWGVKVYITLNTLIKDSELIKAFDYACGLYEMGADAVILQDMGLARLIHKYMPDFPMHLSTQGTVYNRSGVEMAAEMGFTRIVPARECSLKEIREMCGSSLREGAASPEIEVFVHGALCMCYSGQCQMSRLLGEGSVRSGNRGLCAQPCRLQYKDDTGRTSYLLSPKDICTLEDLPALCEAGVSSFKIEGRLKSPEYVAIVTGIYRKYLDLYAKADKGQREKYMNGFWREVIDREDRHDLLQIFNRGGFTSGYLQGNPGREILSGHSPKNQGIPVGKITALKPVRKAEGRWLADVKLNPGESISMGDGVELEHCGNVVTYLEKTGKGLLRIGDFRLDKEHRIAADETVYKVTDRRLSEDALKRQPARLTKADMIFTGRIGECATLQFEADGRSYIVAAENPVEKALKKPADSKRITEQLSRLGDTPFEAGNIDVRVDREAMIPVSTVNSLRRRGVASALAGRRWHRDEILREISDEAAREVKKAAVGDEIAETDKVLIPIELFMKGNREGAIPYILNVTKGRLDSYVREHFEEIVRAVKDSGIAIGNLGWIREFQKAGIRVYGDYGLNVFNRQAELAFAEMGIDVIEWSDELSVRRCRREPDWMNRIPLMITEHPVGSDYLIDRKGVKHDVMKWYSGDKFLIF